MNQPELSPPGTGPSPRVLRRLAGGLVAAVCFGATGCLAATEPNAAAGATPIDQFIRDALSGCGLTMSAEADPWRLLRRANLIVTGLPPSAEEASLADTLVSRDGWERWIDRLLGSPRYGERWAQHWLDAAGYADSNGYFNADTDRPLAYRYRDWVIRSLNQDKPFDQFIREQLAGDELAGWAPGDPVTQETVDLLVATHFLRNGQDGSGESDGNPDEVRTDRYYALESAMQIMGSSLLGLTVQLSLIHI